jgi:hypothetical protein
LHLNTKQNIFEFQLIAINGKYPELLENLDITSRNLLVQLYETECVSMPKIDLKHSLDSISAALRILLLREPFSAMNVPQQYIFVSASLHIDEKFFQLDGSNGFTTVKPCRGAIIFSGHHSKKFSPPTIVEFIFKFIFRIAIKWKYPHFKRTNRHFGQKGCLFDFTNEPRLVRYLILNNFICYTCATCIGQNTSKTILNALDPTHLYSDSIAHHPARIASRLGFNLSLTKGIYMSKYDIFKERISNAFTAKLGSAMVISLLFALTTVTGIEYIVVDRD